MKKNMRRAWAWVMILCMVLSMVPAAAVPVRAEETAPTVNGEYTGGEWAQGGTGTVSYDVDGTQVTLSKTAQAVEGMENTYDITLSVRTSTSTSLKTNAGAVVLVIDRSNSMKYCADCGGNGSHKRDCGHYDRNNNNVTTAQNRMTAAKSAAAEFLASYAGTNPAADRQLCIVTFGTDYTTVINGYDIINTHAPEQTSVTVVKSWLDKGDQDGIQPEYITVELVANGEDTGLTLKLDEKNNWTGSFTELNVNRAGQKITYTVEEISVEGYTTDITGSQSQGFTITNTHETETVDIMKNDTMFGTLSEYDRQSYYEAHKTIWLLTPEECLRLEPIAGFVTRADSDSYTIFETVEELREYLTSAVSRSGFESDADIEQIERIVTLSTCTYQGVDKRYILVCGIREPRNERYPLMQQTSGGIAVSGLFALGAPRGDSRIVHKKTERNL